MQVETNKFGDIRDIEASPLTTADCFSAVETAGFLLQTHIRHIIETGLQSNSCVDKR